MHSIPTPIELFVEILKENPELNNYMFKREFEFRYNDKVREKVPVDLHAQYIKHGYEMIFLRKIPRSKYLIHNRKK